MSEPLIIKTELTAGGWVFRYSLGGRVFTGPAYPTQEQARAAGASHAGTAQTSRPRHGRGSL